MNLIAPVSYKWKEFLFHRECSFNVTSILTSGLIAGGRESKAGRQTIFGYNPHEEESGNDPSKPRKVHYHSKWKNTQDAVYWVDLARAQDKGPRFWQTRSNAVICIQFCAGRLHLQSNFSNRETNFIRETLVALSRTDASDNAQLLGLRLQ